MRLLAVIPTYNERDNVAALATALFDLPHDVSLLFVDDNSPDGTADAVRELSRAHSGRAIDVVVRRDAPRGLGCAYRDGFLQASTRDVDAVLQIDADGQHPVDAVPAMLAALGAGADLVLASRYIAGGGAQQSQSWNGKRRCVSRCGGLYARTLLRLPYRDLTGGFKLWRRELLAAIDWRITRSRGFAFQIESTLMAHRMGAKIAEVPYLFGERGRGVSNMSSAIAREAMWRVLGWAFKPPRVVPFKR